MGEAWEGDCKGQRGYMEGAMRRGKVVVASGRGSEVEVGWGWKLQLVY